MSGYGDFAEVYDLLTFNVPYDEIAEYYADLLVKSGVDGGLLLDMGCGTGSLTTRFLGRGFDIIGQDASTEMLTIAAGKSSEIMWICQNMEETRLARPADAIISTLDSINHLESREAVLKCFRSASDNLKRGGAFIFDVNTVFKHREILGDNTFVYDVDGVYCVWQNTFNSGDNGVEIDLDLFFENGDGTYSRGEEHFREIAFTEAEYGELLEGVGFEVVNIWEYLSKNIPAANSEKMLIAAKKL